MGRHADYSRKEEKEKISLEGARAKLGKDIMTPADYVPLVHEYQGLLVDEKTIKKRIQAICENSGGLLSVKDLKSGPRGAYRFDPSYNELLLILVATECFDGRKNDTLASTRGIIYPQLLKNIEKLSNTDQKTIKEHPSYISTKLECWLMEHITYELCATSSTLSFANTTVRTTLMYEFLWDLMEFRRQAEIEDAFSKAEKHIDSHTLYPPGRSSDGNSNNDILYLAKRKAFESEKLDEFLIALIVIKKLGEDFQYVSPDEVISIPTLALARRKYQLQLTSEWKKKLNGFEKHIANEARYKELVGELKKILNLNNEVESTIYRKFIKILEIEYIRPYVSPEDYARMIRFQENNMMLKKQEILKEIEEIERRTEELQNTDQ